MGEVLETVAEFGSASLELVAWELSLPEHELARAWAHAIGRGLIGLVGLCLETQGARYAVAPGYDSPAPERHQPEGGEEEGLRACSGLVGLGVSGRGVGCR